PLALDELAELTADDGHHVEEILIGLPDLAAEELEDAQDVATEDDRHTEARVQPLTSRDRGPGELVIGNDIGNVDRLTLDPAATRQPDAGAKRALPRVRLELRNIDRRGVPHLDASQHPGVPVDAPQGAHVPNQALAHRSQDARRRL